MTDPEVALERAQQRQAAMAEVLQIISRSAFDLRAVLEAVIERASRLCRAQQGFIYRLEGDWYRLDVAYNITPEFLAFTERTPIHAGNLGTLAGRVGQARRAVQIPDVLQDPNYTFWEAHRLGQYRAMLGVPLIREERVLGVIVLWRAQPEPFTDDEAQLVSIFADQAVVAIEQARHTRELADALEQQTAAGEVLRIISRSTSELDPVFEALVKSAVQLCAADHGDIIRFDPQTHEYLEAAHFGVGGDAYRAIIRQRPYRPGRDTLVGRTILEGVPVQIDDALADPEYKFVDAQRAAGFRSILGVPLLREGFPIGVISVWRRVVRPFSEREIRILTTFADQAVVAVENVRLVRALRRQTEELSRYVTPQVASLIASEQGEALLAGHRRLITAMFCDLRGFSAFSETAEPEEVFGVLREYQGGMGQLISEYGGTLEHLAGDGIMLFFNDPVATPGFEAQTVRCGVAMRDRFRELAADWRRRGYELDLGIGVALGYATLGRVGYEGHFQYNATGNVVILASRLSAEAQGGDILITQRLHAAVEDIVTVEPVREVRLKGFSRQVPVYNVVGLKT
ncbi:MAG TPA: GAF domain-containing protein [Candidatus Dormibacteraeota bacterium]|nr:GAF domain-containing protein [Candidatus Dormibacteraeota bacterium]